MGHLKTLDLLVVAAYALGMLSIGWWSSRRQKSVEEYFVGGRSISAFVAGISIIATLVSTISYLSNPGEMIKNGPGFMWVVLHMPISFFIIGYLVIPHIMAQKVTSGYQLLEHRFGMGVRQAAGIMFIFARIFWMGLLIYTCAFAVSTISGLPLRWVLIGVGVVGTAYTVMGGIRAVMMTDVVQFTVLIGGAVLSIAYITWRCGGVSGWWPDWSSPQLAGLQWPEVKLWSFNPFDRLTVFSAVLYATSYWVLTATADQVVIQRFLSTRDAASARRSFGISMLGDLCTSLVMFTTGLALLGFFLRFPELKPDTAAPVTAQADRLFPHFIAAILPAGLTGLVASALFAAAMSSLDSGISSISTVLITDFPKVFARGCGDEVRLLRRARLLASSVGVVAIAMSFLVTLVPGQNLLEMTVRVSSLLAAPLFVTFALAFYAKSSTPAGAWAAIAVSLCSAVFMTYWQQIVSLFTETPDFSIVLIMPLSALLGFITGMVVSQFTTPRAEAEAP